MAAARRGRTIDPAKIIDVDSWANAYKLAYTNIVHGPRGELYVLDPTLMSTDLANARENPAKTIEHQKAVDYVDILRNPDVSAELRASAHARREAGIIEMDASSGDAVASYIASERELLEAVDAWKAADNDGTRIEAATRVGHLSLAVERNDTTMRAALYPHRYIQSISDIMRKEVDYTTFDDRKIKYALQVLVPKATTVSDRTVATAT